MMVNSLANKCVFDVYVDVGLRDDGRKRDADWFSQWCCPPAAESAAAAAAADDDDDADNITIRCTDCPEEELQRSRKNRRIILPR